MELDDATTGLKVLYVPGHAHGNTAHEDCERGVVSSVNSNAGIVFVRYYRHGRLQDTPQATSPEDLRVWP